MWLSVSAVVLGFLLFAFAGVYTVRQQDHVNVRLCEGQVANRLALRETWMVAHRFIRDSQTTDEGRQAADDLFDGILEEIPPLRCEGSQPVPKEDS